MTESEWENSTDPQAMLVFLQASGLLSERKARLFSVACCRRIWALLPDAIRGAIELTERHADGLASGEELCDPWPLPADAELASGQPKAVRVAADAARLAGSRVSPERFVGKVSYCSAGAVAWHRVGPTQRASEAEVWAAAWTKAEAGEYLGQVGLLRDIFGNPFRPVALDPAWLAWNGGTVRKLAQGIYDDRAFDQLPILADALDEASCSDMAILDHLRGAGPHCLGCWAVSLVLGKE
jgi:hypothetical protein